ncbi:MAG: hypothetical protein VX252_02725 [Myxococcota bacterium]|nr:hypothetical protein [Myxococcota bacterium]
MVKNQNKNARGRNQAVSGMRRLRFGFVMVVTALALQAPPVSAAEEYDASDAGIPIRVVAYVVHPVGVALDYLIFRPAYWIGSYEPFRTVFGRTD